MTLIAGNSVTSNTKPRAFIGNLVCDSIVF
jgi:hypothetical protein